MFIGTKRQAQEAIAEEAKRCGMPFVTERWLGGLLTNFVTVRRSLERLRELEMTLTGPQEAQRERLTKKELAHLDKEREKLEKNLTGIKGMKSVPDAVFVIDTRLEAIAVAEARKLKIPVIGVLDTNCDPDEVDVPIPGNDDALRAIRLFAGKVADAVLDGRGLREAQLAETVAGGAPEPDPAHRAPGGHPDGLTSPGPRGPGKTSVRPRGSRPSGRRGFPRTDIPNGRRTHEHLCRSRAPAPRGDRRRDDGLQERPRGGPGRHGEGPRPPAQEGPRRRREEGRAAPPARA